MDSFFIPDRPRHQRHTFSTSKTVSYSEYDALLRTLLVMFHSGGRYQYFAVEQQTYDDFVSSPSPGRFVSTVLKTHRCSKVVQG